LILLEGCSAMDEDERSPHNIELARELGEKYGRLASRAPLIPVIQYQWRHDTLALSASELLTDMLADLSARMSFISEGDYPRSNLAPSTLALLTRHLDIAFQILAFYRENNLDGVLVSVANTGDEIALENGLGVAPLFDIFNPLARALINPPDVRYEPENGPSLRDWVQRASRSGEGVEFLPQQAASMGFMTLFVDSLRSVLRAFTSGLSSSSVDFTFNSNPPGGYQVQYHPQYYTSPIVFGPTLSTPVTQLSVLAGNYHFLGQLGTAPAIRDPALYTVSSSSTIATTTVF